MMAAEAVETLTAVTTLMTTTAETAADTGTKPNEHLLAQFATFEETSVIPVP